MQKVTVILSIIGVVLVATALVGLTYAQLSTPTPTATPTNPTVAPWWINGDPNVSAPYCYNSTNQGSPYCYIGTYAGSPHCYNGGDYTAEYQSGCHGYGAQAGQYQYGGGMGRWGMHGRGC